jgi:tetratricopeptide (TPR) repeat protein
VAGLPTPDELVELARTDPQAATRAADELDERPEVVYRVAIEHARGLVSLGRLDLDSALTQLTHAADVADDGGHARGAASARRSLAAALTLAGRAEDALLQLDQARLVFRGGTEAAAVDAQRAWILERLGRVDEALVLMNRALAAFVRAGDAVAEANVRNNRGVLLGFRHEHQRAERDLRRAAELYDVSGLARPAAETRANLGWLAARRGEVVEALRWYQSAIDDLDRLGAPSGVTRAALTELYLSARLVREAVDVGEGALVELLSSGAELDAAELRLRLAQAHLLAGAHREAAIGADRAQAAFVGQGRPAWAALARYVAIRARWESGERPGHLLGDAEAVAGELAGTGWAVAALDARLLAGRVALALDDGERADRHLLEARAARRRGPVELRSRAWHAEALRRQSHGDDPGALAAAGRTRRSAVSRRVSVPPSCARTSRGSVRSWPRRACRSPCARAHRRKCSPGPSAGAPGPCAGRPCARLTTTNWRHCSTSCAP